MGGSCIQDPLAEMGLEGQRTLNDPNFGVFLWGLTQIIWYSSSTQKLCFLGAHLHIPPKACPILGMGDRLRPASPPSLRNESMCYCST
jgi:hypothetical protein